VTPCNTVVGYQWFGEPSCLHLHWVVTLYNIVIEYQWFGGPCCLHLHWVLSPCSVAAGYKNFGGPCCLHLQGEMCLTQTLSIMCVWTMLNCFTAGCDALFPRLCHVWTELAASTKQFYGTALNIRYEFLYSEGHVVICNFKRNWSQQQLEIYPCDHIKLKS
jgi:hypothetical protein